jgi:dihydropteroate synthase
MTPRLFRAGSATLDLGSRTLVMGVVNVTPDSFSDGGKFYDAAAAEAHGLALAAEGADILDIGGESTRPGATPLSAEDEAARVVPVIERLARAAAVPLSIDTYKAVVAEAALKAGAVIVNDVWGFQHDPDMARVVATHGAGCILMHNRRQADPAIDIVADILAFLGRSVAIARDAGVGEDRIVIDPGIGFGKTMEQNLVILGQLDALAVLGYPILVGASRKRFIGHVTGRTNPEDRLAGTLAVHVASSLAGAHIIRAHDVAPHKDALALADAIRRNMP